MVPRSVWEDPLDVDPPHTLLDLPMHYFFPSMADDDFTSRSLTNDQLHAGVKALCDQSSHRDGGLPVAPDTAVALTELTLGMCGTRWQPVHAFPLLFPFYFGRG